MDDPRDTRAGSAGTTWTYGYDRGGNLSWKSMYAYNPGSGATPIQTVYYAYGDSVWKDLLTAYNGVTLSWDTIGNLTGDGTWTYTWERGRQLKGMAAAGTNIAYEYNHAGLRVRKTVNNTMTEYWLSGARITHMTHGNEWMHFYYDGQGRPAIVNYGGSTYHYLYDLQGDVIGLVDSSGSLVVEYKYDAWGKPLGKSGSLATTLGTLNPFRYRGYVYDEETGLYYLRSRYYNPEWGRFISADALLGKTGALFSHNLFAYCGNNPVVLVDHSGKAGRFYYYDVLMPSFPIREQDILKLASDTSAFVDNIKKEICKEYNELKEIWGKIKASFDVIKKNTSGYVGVGGGIGSELSFGVLTIDALMKVDAIALRTNAFESIERGSAYRASIGADLSINDTIDLDLSYDHSIWVSSESNVYEESYDISHRTQEYGLSFYFGLGFSAIVSFDIYAITEGIVDIWK